MDYLRNLDSLALASRFRRVLDEIQRQGKRVYSELGLDFEIRWFSVFHFLANNSESTITGIAHSLNLQHPSVVQVVNEMIEQGLLKSKSDSRDRRRRQVSLTPKGRRFLKQLQPIWKAFEDAGREIVIEFDNDLIGAIDKFESALARQSLYDRILIKLKSE
ncbi:MAG: MarR family winged helix-turn-helix transcriptional regulator [candidate division Zixibacteria bacterium]|nr:MarR family winged helix-turn-helix transcriptional regulator [candidate division Zixibacteria bacterium]